MSAMQGLHFAQVEEFAFESTFSPVTPRTIHTPANVRADMHLGVYGALFSCWVAFFSIFWLTFFAYSQAIFLIGFITIFAVVAFGLPVVMNRTGHYLPGTSGSFGDFLHARVATIDGSVSGKEALIQVVLVPACLCIGGIPIGLIITASRFSY